MKPKQCGNCEFWDIENVMNSPHFLTVNFLSVNFQSQSAFQKLAHIITKAKTALFMWSDKMQSKRTTIDRMKTATQEPMKIGFLMTRVIKNE